MDNKEVKTLKIDQTKLITQTEYAKKIKVTPQRVNQMVTEGKLTTVEIKGAILILMD